MVEVSNSQSAGASKSSRMESLVLARGIAALMVVLHHAGNIAAEGRFLGAHAFGDYLTRFTGVSFFFVLSGFFVGLLKWNSIGKPGGATEFVLGRLSRIYLSYWTVLIPLIILYQIFQNAGVDTQRDPINIVFSFFLLPFPMKPVYGVAWTLVYEVFFTFLFALVILWGSRAKWLLPAWAVTIVIAELVFQQLSFPYSFLFGVAGLQFLAGIAVARVTNNRSVPMPHALFSIGMLIYFSQIFFGMYLTSDYFWERVILATGASLIVAGLVGIEKQNPIKVPSFLLKFGIGSFSIYLIHPVAMSFGAHLVVRLPVGNLPIEFLVILLAIIGVMCGLIFDVVVESKVNKIVKERLKKKRPRSSPHHDETENLTAGDISKTEGLRA